MVRIDTCGMSCPQPVLMTKKALDKNTGGVEIIVDNQVAKGNVERFLKNSGYKVSVEEQEEVFLIIAER